MKHWRGYLLASILTAVITHAALIYATPRLLMSRAIEHLSSAGVNIWRVADRVTPISRTIVRPSPDFAYSACVYDLSNGPIDIHVEPWTEYWSLSLYAGNSDNYFVIDDREARGGADVIVTRTVPETLQDGGRLVQSPSTRGIALIRRLAPTPEDYAAAREAAHGDRCRPMSRRQ